MGGSVAAIEAAKSSINGSGGDNGSITSALKRDAGGIQLDEEAGKKLSEIISKDVTTDEDALGLLERSSSEVNSLIDAVNSAVKKAADVTAGEASTGSVMEVVNKIEKKESETENSISRVEKATEEAAKKLSEIISKDVTTDEDALGLLERSSSE